MKGKSKGILVVLALAVFATLGLMNFKQSMTPYVTFAEARVAERAVQVAGFPSHRGSEFDAAAGAFVFSMENEEGEVMNVRYRGGKPGNFDQAESVVVIGHYRDGVMEADQILVKCPSKYEGEGADHPGSSSGTGAAGAASSGY